MVLMRDLRVRNEELTEARAELARAAVAQERERFARDLHDLLGHTLSVIALKAELAGRLLPGDPERAAAEVGEVEQVARQALSEVRDAVSGYRQPTLEGEIGRRPDGIVGGRDRGRDARQRGDARAGRRGRPRLGGARRRDERDPP